MQNLHGLLGGDFEQTVLVRDSDEREAFVADLPPSKDSSAIEAVDMDEHILVVGGSANCDRRGRVLTDGERTSVWFSDVDATPDQEIHCVWAPLTVQAWRVPLEQLDGAEPSELESRSPNER